MAEAKFVIQKGRTGRFQFILTGANGKVVVTSEPYESKAAAKRGIEAVRKKAAGAEIVDETDDAKTTATKRIAPKAAGVTKSARLAHRDKRVAAKGVAASPDTGPVGVEIEGAHLPGRS